MGLSKIPHGSPHRFGPAGEHADGSLSFIPANPWYLLKVMSPSFPLLSRLRQETAAAHQSLEDLLDVPSVILRREAYAAMLAGFYGFHRGVEQALESAGNWPQGKYDPRERRKSPWLAEDLHALGWSAERVDSLPECRPADLPSLGSTAAALGCAYVMEGSTLGGRHISALIAKGSAVPEGAFRFFQGYGQETGIKWREFLEILAVFGDSASVEEGDQAVRSARETFQFFSLWMQRDLSRQP